MAAPIPQQKKPGNNGSGGTSVAATFDATPGANALIVALVTATHTDYSSDPGSISCADNKGNTYTSRATGFETGVRTAIFTAPAATATATFTVTASVASGTPRWSITLVEVRGYNAASPIEKSGATNTSTYDPTFPWSPLNFSATTAPEQLFLGILGGWHGYDRTLGAGTGWTDEGGYNGNNAYPLMRIISKAVTSTGTYDPEWTKSAGGAAVFNAAAISIVAGSDGLGGNNDLAGGATGSGVGAGALTVTAALAVAAVGQALATGALSVARPLTGAAVGQALGAATLSAFTRVWRVPTNAPNGTVLHAMILAGSAPNYTVLAQGPVTVAGGFADLPATGTPGTLGFAFLHNYNDNTAAASIRGGAAIATLTAI